jgi:membrane fusion protein, multidrug efflux system
MVSPKSPNSGDRPINTDEELEIARSQATRVKPKKNSRWPLILGLTLLTLGIGWGGRAWWLSRSGNGGNPGGALASQPQAIPVKLETLTSKTLENSTAVVGSLEAPDAVTVRSEVDGRVSRVLVTEGDRVRSGQVILNLESDELEAELFQAKARLESTKARLAQLESGNRPEDIAEARARLNQTQARLANARGGARPEEIAQAQAQLEAAKAEADLAQDRVKRYRNLSEEGAIAQDLFNELLQKERTAQANVTQAERRLDELSKGRQSDLNELEAQVEQARQNLIRLENGARIEEIAQARAEVAEAAAAIRAIEVRIRKTQVFAPVGGIVGELPIGVGDYVDSGDDLTTITENNLLEINLSVPLEKAPDLRLGLPVVILNSQGEPSLSGKISFISPDITPNSQLILAKAALDQTPSNLFNLQFIQAKIIWDQRPGVLVPSAAVSRLGGQTFVFVAQSVTPPSEEQPQLIAKQVPVKLGTLQGNDYQVLEGLKVGDQIVTAGIMNLRDEMPIIPLPVTSDSVTSEQ